MGKYSYRYVEEKHDKEKRNQKKIDELEGVIEGLIEYENESGFTDEQCFLISYYGLDKEKCKNIKFNMNNIIDNINEMKSVPSIPSEKLEENRHEALLDLFFATENFSEDKANENKDNFHELIKDWNQYSEDFEKNPLIIKQMINLQALNRMAHQYQSLFKDMLYRKYPQLDIESSENDIEDMLSSKTDGIRKNAMQKLVLKFGKEQVRKFNKDEYLKYSANASRWMFKEKNSYIKKILKELQNNNGEYNYGILDDGIIFDVPGYGQFGVHMGWKGNLKDVKEKYDVKDYDGVRLGDVYLLSKASPELLKNVNVDELSEDDKQRYKIAIAGVQKEKEEIIEELPYKEKEQKMIEVLREEGINPEGIKLDTILKKGNPESIKEIIETIKTNKYGIGTDIFYRCNTLLGCNTEKAIDIMLMFDEIDKLGINVKELVSEYPNFLTVSKSDKMEAIYNVLKEYNIDLTNHNIGVAFEGNAKNIKNNMDLLIENGLYDLAKTGKNKFFTSNNKNLNMRINLFKQQNDPLIVQDKEKRKINGKLFLSEPGLMARYGISKKEVLDELGKIKGQGLIKDNEYYIEQDNKEIELSDEQQEISNNIFTKLDENKTDDGMVIKIGEYYYSAIKVKEQIDEIIANTDIQDLENEDINEILKMALLKNKNINQKEVDEISVQIENLTKKEQVDKIQENEEIQDNSAETLENPQQEIETEKEVQGKKITEYTEIKEATNDIIEQEQNIEDVKQIISNLKEVRKTLRRQIQEMEEKLNNTILESDEPSSEVIQDIKKLRKIITEQKEKRKEVKQMIKKYKESKKVMKYTLKQQKEDRNNSIDELEI